MNIFISAEQINLAGSKVFPELVAPAKGTVIEAAAQKNSPEASKA